MGLLDRALKKIEESKSIQEVKKGDMSPIEEKIPDEKVAVPQLSNEITPEDQKNIIPGDKTTTEVKTTTVPKKSKFKDVRSERTTLDNIDQKLTEFDLKLEQKLIEFDLKLEKKYNEFNEMFLKRSNIGAKHELSIDNMIQYFREVKKTKLYELRRYFSDSPAIEINKILKFLYSTDVIRKDKDSWYSLK